jgi:hypothetical protein
VIICGLAMGGARDFLKCRMRSKERTVCVTRARKAGRNREAELLTLILVSFASAAVVFWAMSPSTNGENSLEEKIRVISYFFGVIFLCGGLIAIAERIWGLRSVSDFMEVVIFILILKIAFDWRDHLWEKKKEVTISRSQSQT